MKEDGLQQASSGHANRSSVSSDEEDDQDVLRTVPLPGWSIFDALFISWHDHPEAETSGAAFTDTPIARIQKFRRRFMITVTALLLLSAFTRAWPYFTSSHETRPSTSIPKVPSNSRLSSLFGWRSTSSSSIASHTAPLAGYPLSAAYYAALYNASSPPARLQPSQGRMAMLKAIAKARSSSYDPADFIVNHYDIVQHASTGGDPLDLFAKKASLGVGSPVLRPLAVSAVIVHSPDYDISSTQLIVNMAAKYPFIREIIIWNNDIGLYVNDNTILLPTIENLGFLPPSLRIVNSPSSFAPLSSPIHRRLPASRAKHLACGLATKEVCLFLSASMLPIHLDTLYTTYLSTAPYYTQIVALVNAGDYYRLSHLRFENNEVDLHAGLIQAGIQGRKNDDGKEDHAREAQLQESIVSRTWSRRFIKQIETLTPQMHGEEADIYFSLWMNTFPKLLTAPALAIHDEVATPAVRATHAQLQTARNVMTLHAVRTLYSTLSAQDPFLSPDPFPIAPSPELDDARTPCHDDQCIFESNISPFTRLPTSLLFQKPMPKQKNENLPLEPGTKKDQVRPNRKSSGGSTFNPLTHIKSMEEYEAAWHDTSDPAFAGTFPASILDFQRSSNWYLAVNGRHPSPKTIAHNTTTCWLTPGALNKGSYFGLNLLSPKRVQNIKIIASLNLGNIVGKGQEDLTAESWEVWTKDVPADLEADADTAPSTWSRRAIRGKVNSARIGESTLYEHSFTLSPNAADYQPVKNGNTGFEEEGGGGTSGEDEEEEDGVDQVLRKRAFNDGDGEAEAGEGGAGGARPDEEAGVEQTEQDVSTTAKTPQGKAPRALQPIDLDDIQKGTRIEGIRFISRDRKSQPVRICGFDLDGWAI